ncbi:MAG: hypothetical protein RL095_923 [Verrucomicrobiota bacterium]|jgi:subfamily B ATP-binding cassette protein MsbA
MPETDKSVKEGKFSVYKRMLSYALRYRGRLLLGIVCGLIAGGSIFGVLRGVTVTVSALEGSGTPDSFELEVKRGQEILVVPVASPKKEDAPASLLKPGDQVLASRPVPPNDEMRRKVEGHYKEYPFLRKIGEDWLDLRLDKPGFSPNGVLLFIGVFFLILFYGLKCGADYLTKYSLRWVGNKVVNDLRREIFGRLVAQPLGWHAREDVGRLMSRTMNDTAMMQTSVSENLGQLIRCPMQLLAVVGFIIWMAIAKNMLSLMLMLIIAVPCCLLPIFWVNVRLKRRLKKTMNGISEVSGRLQESLSCIRTVKTAGREKLEQERFDERNLSFFRQLMKSLRLELTMDPLMEFVCISLTGAFLVFLVLKRPEFNILELLPIGLAAQMAYQPIKELSKIANNITKGIAAAERVFEIIDLPHELPEAPDAHAKAKFESELRLDQVSLSYGDKVILDRVSLSIPKGSFVAFVGEAGSGKSTLVNLLARLADPDSGRVEMDGIDLRQMRVADLRRLMSFVDQVTTLFSDSVRYNIAYGVEGASETEILAAAERAEVSGFIAEKSEGFDYQVGAKGALLSGGQRQRIAIARALLQKAPILILDEATSALDNLTEQLVQRALLQNREGRTVIAIAHRLTTVKDADCIFVMDQGRIVEQGRHDQLLAAGGRYTRLWNSASDDNTQS